MSSPNSDLHEPPQETGVGTARPPKPGDKLSPPRFMAREQVLQEQGASKVVPHRLGDLQLRILQLLWQQPGATIGQLHQSLGSERKLAYTTVATMLRKMEARSLVRHDLDGHQFRYFARHDAEAVTRSMADHLVQRLFAGNLASAVCHLLTRREISRDELAEIESLLKQKKSRL